MCSGYEISVEELAGGRGEVRTSSDFREPRQDEQAEPIFLKWVLFYGCGCDEDSGRNVGIAVL